ncbi:hypothetical protein RM844_12240 [Streptomyces sp. DSM 44915]|uniref:Uncharacterized protein n=1 Tax=Streptomyces chisholmiae TaxID=3075540 RepID=A0ABU2JQ05_9ACTN|nr:hypothetical protein [Streptomyces sp. DSM 44915]MDT0267059.1 hypothetical protein [Streptomyces sp. DSM 44915]
MGYTLEAVIAGDALLGAAARELPGATVVPLAQGLALLPMTEGRYPGGSAAEPADGLGFWSLPAGFAAVLARWSAAGPVAYGEADYFGGTGEQRAAVWAAGALVWGPSHTPEGRPSSPAGSPLSQALRRLGATAGGAVDEFAAVGLDRHRSTERWARAGGG